MVPTKLPPLVRKLHELIRANKRDPDEIELIVSPCLKPCSPRDLKKYSDAGIDEVALLLDAPETDEEIAPRLERLAREWASATEEMG